MCIESKDMNIRYEVKQMKEQSPFLASASVEKRNGALSAIADALEKNKDEIFEANRVDLEKAEAENAAASIIKRLKFNNEKLRDVIEGIKQLSGLPDPLGKVLLERQLDEGLNLRKISVPIGVIGVIFEARPDALVQISALCLKSGNCAVLKGGKETRNTNSILFRVIRDAAVGAGLPEKCLVQAEMHNEIDELLMCDRYVDLLIPRGSNAFVQYIMNNTKIPVMGHADGVCHVYVDRSADFEMALGILVDAKTQYTAACNSAETVLVDRTIAEDFLPLLLRRMRENNVKIRGTGEVLKMLGLNAPELLMSEDEFHTEYLSPVISVKLTGDYKEAVSHINTFGSHHTDAIIAEEREAVEYFMRMVDSAGVYHNCSTRFADGFRYGFGAEVGISTSKLHARGPVGLEGLVTYKYELFGSGQIVGDYASGKAHFHFKDII